MIVCGEPRKAVSIPTTRYYQYLVVVVVVAVVIVLLLELLSIPKTL
jgi:hypothetical protein